MNIFVAIPTMNGVGKWRTRISLVRASHEIRRQGWTIHNRYIMGDSIIAHARNVLLGLFMESNCTDLVFVDSDIAWKPGTFTRLMSHDVDVVAGAYRAKMDAPRYNIHFLPDKTPDPKTGLIEVTAAATGFLRLRRDAVQKLVERYAHKWFHPAYMPNVKTWNIFDNELVDNQYWGEDFTFCRRWREAGGKVWLDPAIKLDHIGKRWKPYHGDIGAWLEADNKRSNPQPSATGNGSPAIAAG